MEKLKSRKFLLAITGAIIVIANDGFGLGLDPDTITDFVKLIMSGIGGLAVVDVAHELKKK